MSDNGQNIPVILNFSSVQTDEELKSNSRMVLGFLSAKYESDSDITVTIYFKGIMIWNGKIRILSL